MLNLKRKKTASQKVFSMKMIFLPVIVFILLVILFSGNGQMFQLRAQVNPFSFTAAGDWGMNSETGATLGLIPSTGAIFNLALGDLSYDSTSPETTWCNFVKSYVGEIFPFELVTGNHENEPTGDDGFIDNFAACLPDRMNSVISPLGKYGREYYFDYQNLRVIMIGADNADGSDAYDYVV